MSDPPCHPHIRVRLLCTTDLHMHLMAYDYCNDTPDDAVGLVRTATLIRQARAQAEETGAAVLLLDNGDLLEGTPSADLLAQSYAPSPLIMAMHALGYDAATLGNHDFDFGLDYVDRISAQARFPVLSSNATRTDGATWPDHAVIHRTCRDQTGNAHDLRIGIIGMVPPQVMRWNRHKLSGAVVVQDIVAKGCRQARTVRQNGADLVIALAHTGIADTRNGPDPENVALDLAQSAGIDALIAGHTHLHLPGADHAGWSGLDAGCATLHGVPSVMAGANGAVLGVLDLTLEKTASGWAVIRHRAELRPVASRSATGKTRARVVDDPEVVRICAPIHARTLDHMRRKVGHTPHPLHSYFTAVRPSAALALVAQAQARTLRAALPDNGANTPPLLSAVAPFKTGGRAGAQNYTDIPAGPLMHRHIAGLYPFPNHLTGIRITGAILADWLEMSALCYRTLDPNAESCQFLLIRDHPMYNVDTMYGVTYEIDPRQPPRFSRDGTLRTPTARRIRNLCWNGAPVTPDQPFIVAVNSYRAGGGGQFPALAAADVVYESDATVSDCILTHLSATNPWPNSLSEPWALAPMGGIRATLETGPAARSRLGALRRFDPVDRGVTDQGFLRLDLSL